MKDFTAVAGQLDRRTCEHGTNALSNNNNNNNNNNNINDNGAVPINLEILVIVQNIFPKDRLDTGISEASRKRNRFKKKKTNLMRLLRRKKIGN